MNAATSMAPDPLLCAPWPAGDRPAHPAHYHELSIGLPAAELSVRESREGGWLILEQADMHHAGPVTTPPNPEFAQWLRWNATFEGAARFALDCAGRLQVRAELACRDGMAPPALLAATRVGLARAIECGARHPAEVVAEVHTPMSYNCEAGSDLRGLESVCAEAGWAVARREEGGCQVDLEVPGGSFQARLSPVSAEIGCARVTVGELNGEAPACYEAIACVMLRASAVLRGSRPTFVGGGGHGRARLESLFPLPAAPEDIADALEALCLGCQLIAAEVDLLRAAEVAVDYLRIAAADYQELSAVTDSANPTNERSNP